MKIKNVLTNDSEIKIFVRNMKRIIIMSTVIIFLTTGCKKFSDNPVGPNGSTGLYNLKVGNSWSYSVKDFIIINGKDSVTNQYEATDTILRDTVFNGYTWYSYNPKWSPDEDWITNKEDGVWGAHRNDIGKFDETLFYKFPCSKGDIFAGPGFDYYTKVITIDTIIAVSAGNFKCIQYQYISNDPTNQDISNIFISPGIGDIKYIGESAPQPLKEYFELKSYSLK